MPTIYDRLATLGAPARVRVLRLLELEELAVGELAKVVQMPQSTVSRHLKDLLDHGWVVRRREGTAARFAMSDSLDPEARALWELVKAGTDDDHADDGLRLASVLAAREVDSRTFFGRVGGSWTDLRRELFGASFLLPGLLAALSPDEVIADLGCGAGDVTALLAPNVKKVIAIDREPAMIAAARTRLGDAPHVDLREGPLEAPPLGPGEVDVALLMLVLHHVEDPGLVLRALAPALTRRGRVVILDMVAHDRDEYRRTMGHRHLGFGREDLVRFASGSGLVVARYDVLAPDPEGTGPALFVAVLRAG